MHNLTLHKDINMNVYIYINNLYFFHTYRFNYIIINI